MLVSGPEGVCLLFFSEKPSLARFWRPGRVTDAGFSRENLVFHDLDCHRHPVNKQVRSRVLCMCCIWIVFSKHRWQKTGISGFLYCLTGMRVTSIYLWKIAVTFLTNTTGTARPAHEGRGTLHSPGLFKSLGRMGITMPCDTGRQVWGLHIHSAFWTVNSSARQMLLLYHLQMKVWTCPQISTVTTPLPCP